MKKLFLPVLLLGLFASCEKDPAEPAQPLLTDDGEIVLRERDPSYPLILAKPNRKLQTRNAPRLTFDDYLGSSFSLRVFPFESSENFPHPVIDIEKIAEDGWRWATSRAIRRSYARSFAYSSYEKYVEKSMTMNKVSSGFNLNILGIFKIKNKRTYTETFKNDLETESKLLYGQMDVEIRHALYELQMNTNTINNIREKYLHRDFINSLYNLHPSELFYDYGGFVVNRFYTGGRATAIYSGKYRGTATLESKETDFEKDMEASYGSSTSDSLSGASVSFGFGSNFNNGKSYTGQFTNMETSVITSGGSYGLYELTTPEPTLNMNINLTAWAQSLNNEETHVVIDLPDDSLVPLSEFIMEENLKNRINKYCETDVENISQYVNPKIFVFSEPMGYALNLITFGLITRTSDYIIFRKIECPMIGLIPNKPTINYMDIIAEYEDIFKLEVVLRSPLQLSSGFSYSLSDDHNHPVPFETEMVKYFNPETNMLYLLHEDLKFGYSVYLEDDYLLDTYTIRNWVGTLPEKTFTYGQLRQYTLIAL